MKNPKFKKYMVRIAQLPQDLREILWEDLDETIDRRIQMMEEIAKKRKG